MVCLTYVQKVLSGGVFDTSWLFRQILHVGQMQMGEACEQKEWRRSCLGPWW